MRDDNSVLKIKDYGHINLKLNQLLSDREMNRNQLARAIDSKFEVIDYWCKNPLEKIDTDVLARICFVLQCRVEDILEYCEENEEGKGNIQ